MAETNLTYRLSDDGTYYLVNGYTSIADDGLVVIPDKHNDGTNGELPVSAIDYGAFANCSGLKEITFSKNLTVIANYAFDYCTGLTTLSLPEGVYLLDGALRGCTGLTEIFIPNSASVIEENAFEAVTGLTKVTAPTQAFAAIPKTALTTVIINGGTAIPDYAFKGCSTLKSVQLSDTLTSIGYQAFMGCSSLPEIVIPDSVTTIQAAAFHGCASLQNVQINGKIRTIHAYCFQECTSLTNINIPDTVINIYNHSFASCSALKKLIIPNPDAKIVVTGDFTEVTAFAGASLEIVQAPAAVIQYMPKGKLKEVTVLGDSIPQSLFLNCVTLEKATLTGSIKELPHDTFAGCSNLQEISLPKGLETIGTWSIRSCAKLLNITIPDTVTTISEGAFNGCTALQSINIPSSVTSIGLNVFSGCKSLKVYITDLAKWCNINFSHIWSNPLATTDAVNEVSSSLYLNNQLITNLVIPSGVTEIKNYAFVDCWYIKTINIPDTVKSLGESAFNGCKNIKTLTIPNSVETIGAYALWQFENLEELTIPFVGYQELGANIEDKEATEWSDHKYCFGYIFGEYVGVTPTNPPTANYAHQPKKPSPSNSTGYIYFYCPDTLKKVVVTGTRIPRTGFFGCKKIEQIKVPNVSYIGPSAFQECESLQEFNIPETMTELRGYTFHGCKGLKKINIPNSVTSIGGNLLAGCSSLKELTIPFIGATPYKNAAGTKNYPQYPFGYLFSQTEKEAAGISGFSKTEQFYYANSEEKSFTWVYYFIPSSLSKVVLTGSDLTAGAFSGCQQLQEIELPNTITRIPYYTFFNCNSLKQLEFPQDMTLQETTVGYKAFSYCWGLTSLILPSTTIMQENLEPLDNVDNITYLSAPANVVSFLKTKTTGREHNNIVPNPGHTKLETVIINSGQNINDNCFEGTQLKNITIPCTITKIGDNAFKGCGDLNVYIEDIEQWCGIEFGSGASNPLDWYYKNGNTKDSNLFVNNLLITSLDKPNITEIANRAFLGYSKLDSIILDVNTIRVGQYAFCRNTSLKNVTLLGESMGISTEAFGDCSSLQTVIVKSKDPTFDKGNPDGSNFTFRNVTTISEIEAPISIVNSIISNNSGLRKVLINYATEIPNGLFSTCPSIEEITIPFLGRTKESSNTAYLARLFGGENSGEYEKIPNSLFSVTITEGKYLATSAFQGCSNLLFIELQGTTFSAIGDYAFSNCEKLKQIKIPNTVTTIGEGILCGCPNIETIEIPFLGVNTNDGANGYLDRLFETEKDGIYNSSVPSTLKAINLTNSNVIGPYAFYGCKNIEEITVHGNYTSIGKYAFSGCEKIPSFTMADNVQIIGDNAFSNCSKLLTINLPNTIHNIGDNAFQGCKALNAIILPEKLTTIGVNAFQNCTALRDVTFREVIQKIGKCAFANCVSLDDLVLHEALQEIGESAFEGCTHLNRAIIRAEDWKIGYKALPKTTKLYYNHEPSNLNLEDLPDNVYHMIPKTGKDLDFLGFSFGGTHSYDNLNVYCTSQGLMNVNLTPDRKDITVEVPGGNGMYYFGSFDRAQKFSINFAFDSLTEAQLRRWKQFCNNPNLEDLIFDELPYKVYTAKITGRPILKYVAFDENGERVYKGEGTLEFTCYHPYAHTPRMTTKRGIWRVVKGEADVGFLDGKTLNNYDELTFVTKQMWADASRLPETEPLVGYNPGDLPAPFTFTTINPVFKNDELQVGEAKITIETDVPKPVTWDSKTGLVYYINDNGKKIIVPSSGNSLATIPVNFTGLSVEPTNAVLEYDYWYY